MGGCLSTPRKPTSISVALKNALRQAIEENKLQKVSQIWRRMREEGVNAQEEMQTSKGRLTPLAYSLLLGHCDIFRFLHETDKCSLQSLYTSYSDGKSPMDVVCEQGYVSLLHYFLPFYLSSQPSNPPPDPDTSLFDIPSSLPPIHTSTPAVHRAILNGHLEIVKYLGKHFAAATQTPKELDIHAEDDVSGENSALVAAKSGQFAIIRVLYEEFHADFHKINRRGENSLQLVLLGLRKTPKSGYFFQCIQYLIETIRVDVKYEYEETLLLAENRLIIEYLERKLDAVGIKATKSEIESRYAPIGPKYNTVITDLSLEERIQKAGNGFQLRELFRSELNSRDEVSSIENGEN